MRGLKILLVVSTLIASAAAEEIAPGKSAPALPWGKLVLIGASVSAGFTQSEVLGGPRTEALRLHRYLDAAITAPHEPVANFSTTFFFTKPDEIAKDQVARALAAKPAAILSADFLFWSCYGKLGEGDTRPARFERGLKLLEPVECALVIGDIPDASAAKGKMLNAAEVPEPAEIDAANARLREWAAARKNAAVFPVSEFMKAANANEAITVHGRVLPAGKTRGLLQSDRLHTGRHGCGALALGLLDALVTLDPRFASADVNWDADALFEKVNPAPANP